MSERQGDLMEEQLPGPAVSPVHFLMYDANARDGVCRAVLTLANALSATRPVEVISLYRRAGAPAYAISERVRMTYLLDHPPVPRRGDGPRRPAPRYRRRLTRHLARNLLAGRPSQTSLGHGFPNFSQLTDRVLAQRLRTIENGVIVSTRPALHLAVARLARPGVLTIGQDHLNFASRSTEKGSMTLIDRAAREGLDAFVTLTPSDAADYSRVLAGSPTRVAAIPNALSWPVDPGHVHASRTIVSAGRLVPRKGMGRLIRAFAPVARRHPDWQLRIYGHGRLEAKLTDLVEKLDLTDQVFLEGYTADLPAAFAEASFFAGASAAEGFPMVMLEALSKGLPLVSFDCPRGPGDIIRHGINGLLVPNGDVPALTDALEALVADEALRRSMSAQALLDATKYVPDQIVARWNELIEELSPQHVRAPVAVAG